MNLQDLKDKLYNIPVCSGVSTKDIEQTICHYNDVWIEVESSLSNGEITDVECLQMRNIIMSGISKLSHRAKTLQDEDQAEIKKQKARDLMNNLHISYTQGYEDTVKIVDLYDILADDDKLKALVSRLKMKAFW